MGHVGEATITVYDPEAARRSARDRAKAPSLGAPSAPAGFRPEDAFEVGTSPPTFAGEDAAPGLEREAVPAPEPDVRALWIAAWSWVAAAGTLLTAALIWGVS
jgi:hypothetical protein